MTTFILSLLLQFSCLEVIDPDTVLAMIVRESNGRSQLVHPTSKAMGLLQVKPVVLRDYNHLHKTNVAPEKLLDPEVNLFVGVWHLCRRKDQVRSARNLVAIYYSGYRGFLRNTSHPTSKDYHKMKNYVEGVFHRKWIIRSFRRAEQSLKVKPIIYQ